MFNPRFPHTLRVWRARKDKYGEPMTNDEGNPIYDIVSLKKAIYLNDAPVMLSNGKFDTELVDVIEFGYRTSQKNTTTAGDVEVADFKVATPLFVTPLESGDRVEVTDYDRTYWGVVIKKMSFNLGSNIWFNEVRG